MRFQFTPYLWLLIGSAVISTGLGLYAWRRRAVTGAVSFAVLMLIATGWSLANALEMAGADLATKLFWANVQYLSYGALPLAWLVLVLQYTGRAEWVTPRRIAWLSVEPLITVILAWTNDAHGLIRRNVALDTSGPFPVIAKTYGPWFAINAIYSYLLFLIAFYVLVDALLHLQPLYRRQTYILIGGFLLPMVWNVLYTFGVSPIPRYDIAPAVLGLAGAMAAWGLFRYRLFDVVPVARASVVENLYDGVIVLDAQERVVDINPAALQLVGSPSSSPIGEPVKQVLSAWPDLSERFRDATSTVSEIAQGEGESQRNLEARISPLTDRRGRLTGRLLILSDVTRRTRAEQALRKRNRELTLLNSAIQSLTSTLDLDQVLSAILEEVRDLLYADTVSVWLVEHATGELVCRQATGPRNEIVRGWRMALKDGLAGWAARTGRTAVVPDTLKDERHFRGIDQQTGLELRSILSAPLWSKETVVGVLQVAHTRPDRFKPADLNLVEPLAAAAATAIMNARLYETAQLEIAERERAQEALRQQTLELEARNAELDAYAHTVAHDLKNPLGVLMGYAEVLSDDHLVLKPEDHRMAATEIMRTSQKMNNIIHELLLLSEVRKAEVELEPLYMASIVSETLQRLTYVLETNRGQVVVPDESTWPLAMGHAAWVEEVWVNYISNALKYGGTPSAAPRVELGADTQVDGTVRFWVRDNGPGIAPEDQARLFTPFTRLDQARAGGHGLGLSIVRRIVEKLGGQVGVESQVGEGTTFSFTLAGYAGVRSDRLPLGWDS
jgi:PAS domain S-box-containing protein